MRKKSKKSYPPSGGEAGAKQRREAHKFNSVFFLIETLKNSEKL
jgi:hypothetical protein